MTGFRFAAALAASVMAAPLFAGDITISDPYARSAGPNAPTGAAFMVIENAAPTPDRLLSATSDVAKRVELHTHIMEQGIARMRPVENGIEIPASGAHALKRGGDHVMLMGLTTSLDQGATFTLALTFEHAGEISIEVPVDLSR
jgi:copper(I)-binding protein